MLDLLLIPPALLVILALRAVRQGDYRLHGHLMATAITLVGLRLLLHPWGFSGTHITMWFVTLGAAGTTILLGRMALAWREGRSTLAFIPRIHRASGTMTLVLLALTTATRLLRYRI